MSSDDEHVSQMNNDDLDAIWDSVRNPATAAAAEPATRNPAHKRLIGVPMGQSTFEVDELRKRARDDRVRIPREDGVWTEPDSGDPDAPYGYKWREEAITRESVLMNDPNYMFLTLVAGASNASVERLIDEDSLGRALRMRLEERQAQRAIEESRGDADKLNENLAQKERQQVEAQQLRARIMERSRSDPIFSAYDFHRNAMSDYMDRSISNSKHRDMAALLEDVRPAGPGFPDLSLMRRLIEELDESRSSETQTIQDQDLSKILFWDKDNQRPHYAWEATNLTDMFKVVRDKTDGAAPRILQMALARLITLIVSDETRDLEELDDNISRAFDKFWQRRDRGQLNAANQGLVDRIDGEIFTGAREYTRNISWRLWIQEAIALHLMLKTAIDLLKEKSPFIAPTLSEGDAAVSLMSIMNISVQKLAEFEESVNVVGRLLDGVDMNGPGIDALRSAGVVGSVALHEDKALMRYFDERALDAHKEDARSVTNQWANAMAWYEWMGGSIFREDGVNTKFPATATQRRDSPTGHGVEDPPSFTIGVTPAPAPYFSQAMRTLWSRHIMDWRETLRKVDAPKGMAAPLTPDEFVIYSEMSGGISYEAAQVIHLPPTTRRGNIWRRGPLLLFCIRLYRTDLALARLRAKDDIESRQKLIDSIRQRVASILRGEAAAAPAPTVPYQHRRGWVEQPENSGVVRMLPIVTKAIGTAWGKIQRWVPQISDKVDVEFAQRDPQLREDFSELVAIEMAIVAQRFPKRYIQLGQRIHTKMDMRNLINRLRKYELHAVPRTKPASRARPRPRPAPKAGYVANVQTYNSDGNGILLI